MGRLWLEFNIGVNRKHPLFFISSWQLRKSCRLVSSTEGASTSRSTEGSSTSTSTYNQYLSTVEVQVPSTTSLTLIIYVVCI